MAVRAVPVIGTTEANKDDEPPVFFRKQGVVFARAGFEPGIGSAHAADLITVFVHVLEMLCTAMYLEFESLTLGHVAASSFGLAAIFIFIFDLSTRSLSILLPSYHGLLTFTIVQSSHFRLIYTVSG